MLKAYKGIMYAMITLNPTQMYVGSEWQHNAITVGCKVAMKTLQ